MEVVPDDEKGFTVWDSDGESVHFGSFAEFEDYYLQLVEEVAEAEDEVEEATKIKDKSGLENSMASLHCLQDEMALYDIVYETVRNNKT